MGDIIEFPLDFEKVDRLAKAAADRLMLIIPFLPSKPHLSRGGGYQQIKGYFFPLNSFRTTKLSDLWLLRSWEEHFRTLGIRTKRSFWGGDCVGHLGDVHFVDLAVHQGDHVRNLEQG